MTIFHFIGEGMGLMNGVKEYIVITDDDKVIAKDWICNGFELEGEHEVEDLPYSLPLNRLLIVQN